MTHVLDREKKGDLSWDQSSASGGKKTALRDLGRGRLLTNSGSVLTMFPFSSGGTVEWCIVVAFTQSHQYGSTRTRPALLMRVLFHPLEVGSLHLAETWPTPAVALFCCGVVSRANGTVKVQRPLYLFEILVL